MNTFLKLEILSFFLNILYNIKSMFLFLSNVFKQLGYPFKWSVIVYSLGIFTCTYCFFGIKIIDI